MPYNFRKKSCIPAYKNYIPCGNLSCKVNCNTDNIHCLICNKLFHYKCLGLSKKAYITLKKNNKGIICRDACFQTLFPFCYIDQIDFLDTNIDSDVHPCKKCKKECFGNELMDCIECSVCLKWLHKECSDLSDIAFHRYTSNNIPYICNHRKCEVSIFPFKCLDNDSLTYEINLFPCTICSRDCDTDCIQCDICNGWVHYDCTDLGPNISLYENTDKEFFCGSRKCNLKLLPFDGYAMSFINIISNQPKYGTVLDNNRQSMTNHANMPPNSTSLMNRERLNMLKKKS